MTHAFTMGVDYGTNSVRAVVFDTADGREIGTAVYDYPSGDQGILLDPRDPHLARQNPADYIAGLEASVNGALEEAGGHEGFARDRVIGIGLDTTGSTPIPVNGANRPLALDPRWKDSLAAHAWLWKDHTAAEEAAAITATGRGDHAPAISCPQCGGTSIPPSGGGAKSWRCRNVDPVVFEAATSWVELADFVPAVLAGIVDPKDILRCVCAAGHKALYSDRLGRPAVEGVSHAELDPRLADLRRPAVREGARRRQAGRNPQRGLGRRSWGSPRGCPSPWGPSTPTTGAVGAGVQERHPGQDHRHLHLRLCSGVQRPGGNSDVPGICGIVNGSIMPGYFGIEAGQSAVGDILRWWVEDVCS